MSGNRYALLLLVIWTVAVLSNGCATTVATSDDRAKALQQERDQKTAIAKKEQESKEDAERCSGEFSRSKGYQPINPIPVDILFCQKSADDKVNCRKEILRRPASRIVAEALPNETMRLAIGQVDTTGSVQFGPLTGRTKLGSYIVILDYIKYTSIPITMHITDKALMRVQPKPQPREYLAEIATNWEDLVDKQNKIIKDTTTSQAEIDKAKAEIATIQARQKNFALAQETVRENQAIYLAEANAIRERQNNKMLCARRFDFRLVSRDDLTKQLAVSGSSAGRSEMEIKQYPVYIGVGVRMTAVVSVNDASANLSSFYQLALAAERKQLTGTLVIQTLGISGQDISPFIPMPSEINVTTIQNAIQALATIKAKLYGDKVELQPQVVSFEDEAGRPEAKENVIDAILSGQAAGFSYVSLSLPDGIK